MGPLVLGAPAKVNLFLRVLGRRADGFHEVRTLLQAIDLHDEVRVELGGEGIDLSVVGQEPCVPRENLAWIAAERFAAATGLEAGVRVRLEKRIPAGAGLGGGSSDAGAVLRALCRLTGVEERDPAVTGIARGLGSDVPFFLCGSPLALATGRGDALEPLAPLPEAHLVVCLPPVHVSTASAYGALARAREEEIRDVADREVADREEGAPTRQAARGTTGRPRAFPEGEVGAGAPTAARPRTWSEALSHMGNDFETIVARSNPPVARSLEALLDQGATGALLCGSGAACFGFFPHRIAATAAADVLTERLGWSCVPVRTLVDVPRPA